MPPRATAAHTVWRAVGFSALCLLAGGAVEAILVPLVERTPLVDLARTHRVVLSFWWDLAAVLIATAVAMRFLDGDRPTGWGAQALGRPAWRVRALGVGFLYGSLAMLAAAAALLLGGRVSFGSASDPERWWGALFVILVQMLPAAANEELLFRGYLLTAIEDGAGRDWAVGLTSMLFGMLHAWNPDPTGWSIANVTLAGVMLAVVRLRFKSLYAAMAAHLGWNIAQVAILHAPVSGVVLPHPGYVLVDHGPGWLTGGSWGPEGGVAASLALGVAIFLLLRRPQVDGR